MDLEDESFGDEMSVQITIHVGDKCGVELSTLIKVSSQPTKARVKIADIVTTLLESVPLATLRGHERVMQHQPSVAIVMKDGSLIEVTPEIERAIIEQAKLRERMEKKKDAAPE
jgi:hypothetical protein